MTRAQHAAVKNRWQQKQVEADREATLRQDANGDWHVGERTVEQINRSAFWDGIREDFRASRWNPYKELR